MKKNLQTSIYAYLESASHRARRGRTGNFEARFAEVRDRSCSTGFIFANALGAILGLGLGSGLGVLSGNTLWAGIFGIFFCGLGAVASTSLLRLEAIQEFFRDTFGITSWVVFPDSGTKTLGQLYIDALWIIRRAVYSRSAVFLDSPATLDVELPGGLRTLDAYGFTTSYHMLCITSCTGMFAL